MNIENTELGLPKEIADKVAVAVDTNPEAIVALLSDEGIFLFVAPSIKEILGYDSVDMLGRRFTEFYDPIDAAHVSLAFYDTILNGQSLMTTRVVRTKSGTRKRMRGSGQKLTDPKTGGEFVLSISKVAE